MLEMEEDMLPPNVCGNCLGTKRVRFDARSGRRLCIECEPNPDRSEDWAFKEGASDVTKKQELRKCIGSAKYGIEGHEAPVEDFPKQPSQKDGLGRMCKPHWNQYTSGLARDRKARMAAEGPVERITRAAKAAGAKVSVKPAPARSAKGETPAVTARRQGFEKRLAKVGVGSDAGQRMLENAAKAANGKPSVELEASLIEAGIADADEVEAKVAEEAAIA